MNHPLPVVTAPRPARWSRRRVLRSVGAAALLGHSAKSVHAQPSQTFPATPLGDQFVWILTQINGAAATLTEVEAVQHFAPSLLAVLPPPAAIAALQALIPLGPFTFRGFPDLPTATAAVATVSIPSGKLYRLALAIEPSSPSRIVNLLVSAIPEVAYAVTPIGPAPGNLSFAGDLFFNDAGQIVCSVRLPASPNGQGTLLKENGVFTTLLGPNGENIFRPRGIDAMGRVIASWTAPDQAEHGCIWQAGQLVDLGPLPGGRQTRANGMNADGVVVGWSTSATPATTTAVRWVNGQPAPLNAPPGAVISEAVAINAAGQIAGYAMLSDGMNRALLWDGPGVTDLGPLAESVDTGYPGTGPGVWDEMNPNPNPPIMGLNDQGQVAWTGVADEGVWHPFRWANGGAVDLGALDDGQQTHEPLDGVVTALAGDGLVVGWAMDLLTGEFRPFLYEDGPMIDLGVLPGGRFGSAVAIGGFGRIVGWSDGPTGKRAVVWGEWGLSDLGTLPGDLVSDAVAANTSGQVLGWS